MKTRKNLPSEFYLREDVLQISKDLLGHHLCTRNADGVITSGIITETEAYKAPEDKASHAYQNKRTPRTETMFRTGGIAYVYLIYGIHQLFNVVTNVDGAAHAVLIRSIEPLDGISLMQERRDMNTTKPKLTAGPGRLTQALGITGDHNARSLRSDSLWIEEGEDISETNISALPRVGIDYAEEYAGKPWRFIISDSEYVST